jgi:tetratricopeptide (TPR) repeat protein
VDHHPSAKELEGLVVGGLSAGQKRTVVTHLVRGCPSCGAVLAQYVPLLAGRTDRAATPPPPEEIYDGALSRAVDSIRRLGMTLPVGKTPEQKKQEAVDRLAARGVAGLAEVPPQLLGVPLVEALLERSWTLRHEDPATAVELARCAAQLGEGLSAGEHDELRLADLRCRTMIELGNAFRVADDLEPAEAALQRATELFLLGTRDDLLAARLFDVQASLYAARRDFDLAVTSLDIVADVYRRHGDGHLAGRALISKGIYLGYKGDAEEAVRLIALGLSSLDPGRDPGLVSSSVQTQGWFLVDCGRFLEARAALRDLQGRDPGGRVNELKVRWLEGHIAAGLHELGEAERALRQVRKGFEEIGLGYKAALVGLELGAVWLQQEHPEAAEGMALECTDMFLAMGIQRELLASILVLRKAAESRGLTLALLRQVIDALQEGERGPARFRAPAQP